MGLSNLVYPGAHHTRFEHAIGAMHVMRMAVNVLKQKGIEISHEEIEAMKIAVLLHDIGHGPFSHASENILIKPAGELVPNSGHHHLLINVGLLPDLSMPIPASDQFIHFGKGQESTVIDLPKGRHKLQLILGNHVHVPHKPPVMSDPIYVEVK